METWYRDARRIALRLGKRWPRTRGLDLESIAQDSLLAAVLQPLPITGGYLATAIHNRILDAVKRQVLARKLTRELVDERQQFQQHDAADAVRTLLRGKFTRRERKILGQWSKMSRRLSIRQSAEQLGVSYKYLRMLIRRLSACQP